MLIYYVGIRKRQEKNCLDFCMKDNCKVQVILTEKRTNKKLRLKVTNKILVETMEANEIDRGKKLSIISSSAYNYFYFFVFLTFQSSLCTKREQSLGLLFPKLLPLLFLPRRYTYTSIDRYTFHCPCPIFSSQTHGTTKERAGIGSQKNLLGLENYTLSVRSPVVV